jgi:hypothetical protein
MQSESAMAAPGSGRPSTDASSAAVQGWNTRALFESHRTVLLVALAAVLLTQLPRLALYFAGPPGHVFLGSAWGVYDAPPYLQIIGDAAHGQWLYGSRAPGNHEVGRLLYTPYILLGHLLGWTGWGPDSIFEVGRWAGIPVVLAAGWLFIRSALAPGLRGFGYFAAVLAGGLGWAVIGRPETFLGPALPLDLAAPSFTVANSLQMGPHVMLAVAGLAVYFWGLLQAANGRWRGLWGSAALAAVASFHGFIVPMALLAGTAFVLWRSRTPTAFAALAAAYLLSAPFLAYLVWLRLYDANTLMWVGYEPSELENIPSLIVSRAVLLPLIAVGAWRAIRRDSAGAALSLCWVTAALGFDLYPGFSTNALHRTVEGSSLAYGVLAAGGFQSLRGRPRFYIVALACVSVMVQPLAIVAAYSSDQSAYMSRSDHDAALWLRETGTRSTVLASPDTVRWVAALSSVDPDLLGNNVVRGHLPIDDVVAAPEQQRAALLRNRGDRYLFWGERERLRDGPAPSGLRVAYDNGQTKILLAEAAAAQ